MKILVIGHSLVVDSNRKFWSVLAKDQQVDVHLVVPSEWNSNLVNALKFCKQSATDQELTIHPIPVYFKGSGSFYFYKILQLYKILENEKYDAIIVTQETWSLSAFQLGFLKKITKNAKTPAHLSLCQNIIKPQLKFAQPFERLITSFYDTLFYCDSAICSVLDWKKIRNRTAYWPFSFDSDIYKRSSDKLTKTLKIGYLGRISEEKGLRSLIAAFEELRDENKIPVQLVIAGNGPLKDLAKGKDIEYLGVLPHNQAHLFYQKINIFILPSLTMPFWKEQFGRVIVESVASGVPVIGSSSGAIPEVLSKIGLKTVFEEGNKSALKKAIIELWAEMNSDRWGEEMDHYFTNNMQFSHKAVAERIYNEITNQR
ncbi:MAG: glycosyltransferase [Bacteriovorax sp.]|nr:glycosyltransferase [Bacteriovorax sp.]